MRFFAWLATAAVIMTSAVYGFEPPDFTFLLTARASAEASKIVITWPRKNVRSIKVKRKAVGEKTWGTAIAELGGNATVFEDRDVQRGRAYEYEFSGQLMDGEEEAVEKAYGYICAGIEAAPIEQRGKVALIVDDRFVNELRDELEILRKDLIGDGWSVVRHDVSPSASAMSVKELIKADYASDPEKMRAVFLIGHVPVPYSGLMNPDMHEEHLGAWPADVYYGDVDGVWTDEMVNKTDAEFSENNNAPGDGKFDQSEIPSEVELEVGRVDMWDLPAFEPRTELEMLRDYLRKNHAFRHGLLRAPTRGLIRDNFGVVQDDAPAADAWRAFPALFGDSGWKEIGADEFFPTLNAEGYLWAFGAGGGDRDKADGVGWTYDFAAQKPKAIFYLLHGSYFGDWNTTDNFLRAALASEGDGLVSIWSSLPHWFLHHLAMGETVGFATKLVQNNRDGFYKNDPDLSVGQAHISMMGDPTLRVFPLAPPRHVRVSIGARAKIAWDASSDEATGYNVYRARSFDETFVKLNSEVIRATEFVDATAPEGRSVYMVKAVGLQTTGSGTFWNLSQGIAVETEFQAPVPAIIMAPKVTATGWFAFEAKGVARRAYAVESRTPSGDWRMRANGVSDDNGLLRYEEALAGEAVCELYRVVWE